MKLLVDMNLTSRWVGFLANAGFTALHWAQVGRHDAPDVEIMSFACAHDFAIMTHDLDFGAILAAAKGEKPSVIQVRGDRTNPENIGPMVLAVIDQLADELTQGALVSIDTEKVRLRVLPLVGRR